MTRIAGSDPVMWRDIFLANKVPLRESLQKLRKQLDLLDALIEKEDAAGLESYIRATNELKKRQLAAKEDIAAAS